MLLKLCKEMSVMLASFLVLLVLPSSVDSSVHNHTNIQHNPPKYLNPQLSFQIIFHAFLLWASIGFLMPVGVLVIRMSHRVECGRKLKALFYSHVILQITAVFLALAGAILSIIHFENSFDNTHQRIGLVIYGLIVIQPLVGFFRPQRGVRFRSMWYFVHWFVGNGICIMGMINIYIGLHAFHARTSKSVRLWTVLFTVEVCVISFIYLLQDRWDYIQKQGVILGNEQIRPTDHSFDQSSTQKDDEAVIPHDQLVVQP